MKANWRGCIMQTVVTRAALAALLFTGITGSHVGYGLNSAQAAGKDSPVTRMKTGLCESDQTFTIVIHGGSVFWRGNHAPKLPVMKQILTDAHSALSSGARAIDVVEAVIAGMENSGLYNAGKGAIANQAGVIELDASIMDGRELKAGAVAAVKAVRNPIIAGHGTGGPRRL
jgi:Asparaginase